MPTLHIVSASPDSGAALQECLESVQKDAAILLIENGVYACAHPRALQQLQEAERKGVRVQVLLPDLQARGLASKPLDWIEVVDYAGFVKLVTEHPRSVTWA